jgi:hypothetical protein
MDSARLGRLRLRQRTDANSPPPLVDRTGWSPCPGRCVVCGAREESRQVEGEWEWRCSESGCKTRSE